jgi:hypothetical protein
VALAEATARLVFRWLEPRQPHPDGRPDDEPDPAGTETRQVTTGA